MVNELYKLLRLQKDTINSACNNHPHFHYFTFSRLFVKRAYRLYATLSERDFFFYFLLYPIIFRYYCKYMRFSDFVFYLYFISSAELTLCRLLYKVKSENLLFNFSEKVCANLEQHKVSIIHNIWFFFANNNYLV